jgi:hypothetical protein
MIPPIPAHEICQLSLGCRALSKLGTLSLANEHFYFCMEAVVRTNSVNTRDERQIA